MINLTFIILSLTLCENVMAKNLTLFIGDSHSVTTFGRTLDKNLQNSPRYERSNDS